MSRFKKLTFFSLLFFLAMFLFIAYIGQQYVVPIVMYHSITPDAEANNRLAITPWNFERQMKLLKTFGYNVVSLEEIADLIRHKQKIPNRTIAITFDDGYKNNYTYAFKILKKYNFPATVFVIIDEIGRPQNDRLDWGEIREMLDSGLITIGSHCLGPEPLVNIETQEELKKQIFNSRKILQDKLGREINAFSYPEGRFNDRIKQLVIDAGYQLAVVTSPGKKFPDEDIFALKRLRISATSNNLFVFWIETSGFYTFIKEHRDDD